MSAPVSANHLAVVAAPDLSLPALEQELSSLLVEHERLRPAWPRAPHIMDRYRIGTRLEEIMDRVQEIQNTIAETDPHTLADAAVQLRRALAAIEAHDCRSPFRDDSHELATRLVTMALGAVEAAA